MDKIKNLIETIYGSKPSDYGKDFMKIKFSSDYNLPLNKTLKLQNMTIVIRSVFSRGQKIVYTSFFRWMFVWIINFKVW